MHDYFVFAYMIALPIRIVILEKIKKSVLSVISM